MGITLITQEVFLDLFFKILTLKLRIHQTHREVFLVKLLMDVPKIQFLINKILTTEIC